MIDPVEAPPEIGRLTLNNPYRDWPNNKLIDAMDNPHPITRQLVSLQKEWAREHPDTYTAMVAACNFLHSIFLYPDILDSEELTSEQKTICARLAHNQVHHLFYASSPKVDTDVKKAIFSTAVTLQTAAGLANRIQENHGFSTWWSGIKNELAVLKLFHQLGYEIRLPNYLDDKPGYDNETLQLDVRSGVDVIVTNVNQRVVWLVDAKGRADLGQVQVMARPYVPVLGGKESWMVNHLRATLFKDKDVNRATIILPGRVLHPLGTSSSFEEELTRFCRLPDAVTQSITQSLQTKR